MEDKNELDKWARALAAEMNISKKQKPEKASNSVKDRSGLTNKPPKQDFLEESKGDIPIDDISPKVKRSMAGIPGYVSKFRQHLNDEDKSLIETAEDLFTNRTDWNIDRAGAACLYYTSKPLKRIEDEWKMDSEVVKLVKEESSNVVETIMVPAIICIFSLVYFLSHLLPQNVNIILSVIVFLCSASVVIFHRRKANEAKEALNEKVPYEPYKIKVVSNVVGLPDDIANALTEDIKRKQWDICRQQLKEETHKHVFYRKSATQCQILEQRLSAENNQRETFIDISKIKGKPYFLRLSVYTKVTEEMYEKIGEEGIKNNVNSLRNFVLVDDSLTEMNVSLSNIKGEGENLTGNPTLTITDMIGEIEEVDMGDDAKTEHEGDEETKDEFHEINEEVKDDAQQAAPTKEEPKKELTFEEKFFQQVSECPTEEQPFIRKAYEGVQKLENLANETGWKEINKKGGINIIKS